jgi:L-fuculose-phosphate aldolase
MVINENERIDDLQYKGLKIIQNKDGFCFGIDAVLLANHGALTFSDSLLNAYHKMESVEFYAKLLFNAKLLGGPKELSKEQVERLYEIRRQFGLKGKHPANVCVNNKDGKSSCHSCGGSCGSNCSCDSDADVVAEITRKVIEQLGLKK